MTTAVIPSANGTEVEDKTDIHDEGQEKAWTPVADNSLSSEDTNADGPTQADEPDNTTEPVPDEKGDRGDREQTESETIEKAAESLPDGEILQKAGGDNEADTSDKLSYIGDSTWEERAWREIIRLKEDMFWARVGASR